MKHDNLAAGGPAFPVADPFATHQPGHEDEARRLMSGMTLRDYFAVRAMQSLIVGESQGEWEDDVAAKSAYRMADAMLRERAKTTGGAS